MYLSLILSSDTVSIVFGSPNAIKRLYVLRLFVTVNLYFITCYFKKYLVARFDDIGLKNKS